jgi:hypothetical protein
MSWKRIFEKSERRHTALWTALVIVLLPVWLMVLMSIVTISIEKAIDRGWITLPERTIDCGRCNECP